MKSLTFIILFIPSLLIAEELKVSNESQLSVIQTGGNSSVETYNLKTTSKLNKGLNNYELGGHYVLGTSKNKESGDVEKSALNWDAYVQYARDVSDKTSLYGKLQMEGDEFSGYKQRDNYDIGAKYSFIKSDKKNLFAEAGLRYTLEKALVRDEDGEDVFKYNKGRLYSEYSEKKNKSLTYKFWIEYLPNFTDNEKYLFSFEPSLSFLLSETFSFKFAYKGSYNNDPGRDEAGDRLEYLDYTTTTSLIAVY